MLILLICACGPSQPENDPTATKPLSPTNTSVPVSPTPTSLPSPTPTPQPFQENFVIPDCIPEDGHHTLNEGELSFEPELMESYRFRAIYRYKSGEEYAEDELSIELKGEYSGLLSEPESLLYTADPSQSYSRSHTMLTDLNSMLLSESIITEQGVWIRALDGSGWIVLNQGSPSHFYNSAELFAWDEMVMSHVALFTSDSKMMKQAISIDGVEATHLCSKPDPIGNDTFNLANFNISHGEGIYTILQDAELHLWTINEGTQVVRLAVKGTHIADFYSDFGYLEQDPPNDFLLWVEWSDINQRIEIIPPSSEDVVLTIPDEEGEQKIDSDAPYNQLPLPPDADLVSDSEKEWLEEIWSNIYESGITPENAVIFKPREYIGVAYRFEDKLLSNKFDSRWYNLPLDRRPIYETEMDGMSLITFYAEKMHDLGWYLDDAGFQLGSPNKYTLFFVRDNVTLPIILEDGGEKKSRIQALLPPNEAWIDSIKSGWVIYNESNSELPNDNYLTSIAVDQNGRAWISCMLLDSCPYFLDDGKWTDYTDFLPEMQIPTLSMDVDKEGRMWIGSVAGIFTFDGEVWTDFSEGDPNLTGVSNIIVDDDNNVWISSEAGISVFDGSIWRT